MLIGAAELERVKRMPLFSGLPADVVQQLLGNAVLRVLRRHAVIFVQDDPAEHFFFVFDGWVKLYRLTEGGDEAIVEVFGPDESFAEGVIHEGAVYPVCAETVADSRLLALPTEAFRKIIYDSPKLAFNVLATMSSRLKSFVRRTEQYHQQSAAQRVASFLLKYCDNSENQVTVRLPYDKMLIAGRLGMTPETFSRSVAKLRSVGAYTSQGEVRIEDVGALREFERGP